MNQRLPLFFQVAGSFLRKTPYFRGKRHIRNLVAKHIRCKGYTTTISFDLSEKILLNLDDWIPYHIFLTGVYAIERYATEFFCNILRKGLVFLDIGANTDYYTLLAAARVGLEGQVHAFEPVSETFKRLIDNIRINNFKNVFANRCIVHDHHGEMDIFVADKTNTGSSSLSPVMDNYSNRVERVETITIDSYIEQKGLRDVHIVKIDVEGSELYVLKGMMKLLNQSQLQLFIEISEKTLRSQGTSPEELFKYLKDFGFYPFKITKTGLVKVAQTDIHKIHDEPLLLFRKGKMSSNQSC